MGYTGNFVCGVWFGNDDYTSTNRMTGGSLPAMTWHNIMAYAHEGIEIKPLPGVAAPKERQQPAAVAFKTSPGDVAAPPARRPVMLSKRGSEILSRLERMLDDANRALGPPPPSVSTQKRKQATNNGDALASALEGRAFERN
jgi:penicillin-binding protein 1A